MLLCQNHREAFLGKNQYGHFLTYWTLSDHQKIIFISVFSYDKKNASLFFVKIKYYQVKICHLGHFLTYPNLSDHQKTHTTTKNQKTKIFGKRKRPNRQKNGCNTWSESSCTRPSITYPLQRPRNLWIRWRRERSLWGPVVRYVPLLFHRWWYYRLPSSDVLDKLEPIG